MKDPVQNGRDNDQASEHLVFPRLQELFQPILSDQIIRFPIVFSKICSILCLTKNQAWLVFKELQDSGKIEIVPYQGVRIKRASMARAVN
jgi:hypothetical protein